MITRISTTIALFFCVISLFGQGLKPTEGTGAAGDPYEIEVFDHLVWMSENFEALDKSYIQVADIDASSSSSLNGGAGFKPIGTYQEFSLDLAFSGNYNGDGYTISNLFINRPDTGNCQGLFGCIRNGVLSNLTLEDASVAGNEFVGILCGVVFSNTLITGCSATGNVTGTDSEIGGLFGTIYGGLTTAIIDSCSADVSITATGVDGVLLREAVGGLTGFSDAAEIRSCTVEADIDAPNYRNVGGLTGSAYESDIRHNEVSGAVLGREAVGGFTGYASYVSFDSCYTTATVESTEMNCGGFGGGLIHCTVSYCHSLGDVISAESNAGGFTGFSSFSTFDQSFANGHVSSEGDYTGGFAGHCQQGTQIRNCYARGNVESTDDYSGGFIGLNNGTLEILNSYSTGKAESSNEVGGFSGYNIGPVTDCFWDMESSGLMDASGTIGGTPPEYLTGKNTQEMKDEKTFTLLVTGELSMPWDFVGNPFDDQANENIWAIDPGINDGYPYLTKNISPRGVSTSIADYFHPVEGGGIEIVPFPNPWSSQSDELSMTFLSGGLKAGVYSVWIRDVQGKVLHNERTFIQRNPKNEGVVDLTIDIKRRLDPGMYFIALVRDKTLIGQGKLIINH